MKKMSDPSRFTPLYVNQMFLNILYRRNKHIVIPEVFLEFVPELEKTLCRDLNKIKLIANSGDSKKIIKHITEKDLLINFLGASGRYNDVPKFLFHDIPLAADVCNDLNDFMQQIKYPEIINCDAIRELLPATPKIMIGDYDYYSVLSCIFRYILYTKTKDLHDLNGIVLNFEPVSYFWYDGQERRLVFNY